MGTCDGEYRVTSIYTPKGYTIRLKWSERHKAYLLYTDTYGLIGVMLPFDEAGFVKVEDGKYIKRIREFKQGGGMKEFTECYEKIGE